MKKRKKIPKFKSEKEEAEFWSKHSPLDYPDEFKEIKKSFQLDVNFLKKMAKERKEKKRQDPDMPIGKMTRVKDFLPPPEELVIPAVRKIPPRRGKS